MKRKNMGLMIGTLAIVGVGSIALMLSVTQIKGSVQDYLSDEGQVGMTAGTEIVETEKVVENSSPINSKEDESIHYYEMLSLEEMLRKDQEEYLNLTTEEFLQKKEELDQKRAEREFIYQGQEASISDSLLEKDEALENGARIMDFIFSYVDEVLLQPMGIDKTKYEYSIQRQRHKIDGVNYGVFIKEEGNLVCSVGVRMDEELVMTSFERSALVELCGGEREIPEEYLVNNWCETAEKREAIYTEYLEQSKEVVAMLGLPAIAEDSKYVDCITYFDADDGWSNVTFGDVLEDGRFIKIFYNRVNQMWEGFLIAGYKINE